MQAMQSLWWGTVHALEKGAIGKDCSSVQPSYSKNTTNVNLIQTKAIEKHCDESRNVWLYFLIYDKVELFITQRPATYFKYNLYVLNTSFLINETK